MPKIKKINHVAVAVEDIETAMRFWQDALGIQPDHIEEVPSQKAKVAFLPIGESEVELVQPTDEETGMAKFLKERGGGVHHLCLEVDDIQEMMNHLKGIGIRLINAEPLELKGRKLAFIHPKSTGGVLIELYELI